jgi:hypothetical protein
MRPRLERLEDRLVPAPVTFTFRGVGRVPTGSGFTPFTAYERVQAPTREGDVMDVFVQLSSDVGAGEAGEVLWGNKEFADGKGNPEPNPDQVLSILSTAASASGVSFIQQDADYSGSGDVRYQIPSGNGQFIVFSADWDGDEAATIHMTLKPTFPRDVTNLFQVQEINRHQHAPGSHHLHVLPDGRLILTVTNQANLPAFAPAASLNPSTVPLAIQGPFYVVLDGLPRSQKLAHPSGFTEDGRPYVEITLSGSDGMNNGVVDHGESLSLELRFKHHASGGLIRFTTEVWAGQTPP